MAKDPREGGRIWHLFYKMWAGPAMVENAVEGCTEEAREAWRLDLAERRRYTREQRARKEAARSV
jgi:hypothetical protein